MPERDKSGWNLAYRRGKLLDAQDPRMPPQHGDFLTHQVFEFSRPNKTRPTEGFGQTDELTLTTLSDIFVARLNREADERENKKTSDASDAT